MTHAESRANISVDNIIDEAHLDNEQGQNNRQHETKY